MEFLNATLGWLQFWTWDVRLGWMEWTWPTAFFFIQIAEMLVVFTILEVTYPTVERKGFLPIATTRGDRLFQGLLSAAWLHLLWLLAADVPAVGPAVFGPGTLWGASIISLIWLGVMSRWG